MSDQYWIQQGDHPAQGPFPLEKVQSYVREGRVRPEMYVSTDGSTWQRGREIHELFPSSTTSAPQAAQMTQAPAMRAPASAPSTEAPAMPTRKAPAVSGRPKRATTQARSGTPPRKATPLVATVMSLGMALIALAIMFWLGRHTDMFSEPDPAPPPEVTPT